MSKEDEIVYLLREILKWTRFSGLENARSEIRRTLDTDQKRLVYTLSDGENNSREIAEKCDVSDFTVRKYWSEWNKRGIVSPMSVRGGTRYKKSFDLEDFGLIVPEIKIEKGG